MSGSEKSDGAFRTIREVADWLGVPTHVLRFWESKFEEIAPVKGAGGRRYYRPEDMKLLGGVKVLLHDQGLTIRGVSQRLDDDGVESVMALSPDLDAAADAPARKPRVLRDGAEAPVETTKAASTVVPFAPPAEVADPVDEIGQPDSPDPDHDPGQPTDVEEEPDTDPEVDPTGETAPQPTPEPAVAAAPGADPVPPATRERGVEVEGAPPAATPEPSPPGPVDAAQSAAARPRLTAVQQRSLRRIVRKLRGLIEEVEEDLGTGGSR